MKKSEKLCNIHIVFVLKLVGKCAIIRVRAAVYVLSAYSLCRLSAHLSSKMHLLFYTIIFISFRRGVVSSLPDIPFYISFEVMT